MTALMHRLEEAIRAVCCCCFVSKAAADRQQHTTLAVAVLFIREVEWVQGTFLHKVE